MLRVRKLRPGKRDQGVALLIAIFVLLLISVVAIALLVSSGTETALGANYRSSSTVYYAALAGLEEVRGRLLPKNPNYFGPSVVPNPLPLGNSIYIINALPGETVAPWDPGNPYYDTEFGKEFPPMTASGASWTSRPSVWNNNVQGIPGPVFKWVRITAATEQSLNLDIDSNGYIDSTTPIYYNPAATDWHGNPAPSLIVSTNPPATAKQALEITAFAYLPNGSQKLLQYLVTPSGQNNLSFPAALTLDGPHVGDPPATPLNLAYGSQFYTDGTDGWIYSSGGSCVGVTGIALGNPHANPSPVPVYGVGFSNNDDSYNNILNAIHSNWGEYPGIGFSASHGIPSLSNVSSGSPSLAWNLQTVSGLNALVASLSQQADVTLTGPITQSDSSNVLPSAMSATNPMMVVVNGDFTENGFSGTGYGILVVTGTFTYDQNSVWNGIILVIGKGAFVVQGFNPTNGAAGINGAVLVADTVDAVGSTPASPTFNYNAVGNNGIFYSSCWVQYVQSPSKYQVLSFHEIQQP